MLSREIRELENENYVLKEAMKELEKKFEGKAPKPMACEYCMYYIQHYTKNVRGQFISTHCGTCTHGRAKKRKPDETCQYFELGTYDMKWHGK